MAEKRFVSAAETADFEQAQVFDKLRVGELGVYFRDGLRNRFVPYGDIDRAFIRIHEVNGRMCCGNAVFHYFRMVFVRDGKESEIGTLAEDAYSSVTVDDEREAETAVSYLIENGHRDVAILLSCAKDGSVGELRYAGYKNALAKAGIPADPALTAESGGYSLHGAYRAAAGLAASGARFTALFAAADTMALAAVRALFDAGLRVPEDVSVISIDGISVSQYTVPALTTLVQPAEELGRTAVSMLVAIIRGEAINRHVTLAAALRKGESVKKVSG